MTDYTLEQVMTALRNADAAGDTEGAKRLAQIAAQMRDAGQSQGAEPAPARGQMMSQFNRGVADVVDFFNPFDTPATGFTTGSARDWMEAGGIETAEGDPQTAWQAVQRGAGEALASAPVIGGLANAVAAGGTRLAPYAERMAAGMRTRAAVPLEAAGGGASRGAQEAAENAGADPWLAQTAGIVAPLAPVAALGGLRAAGRAATKYMPGARAVRAAVGNVKAAMAPYTEAGGREVARQRMQDLAGGQQRAAELAGRIGGDNPLGLTAAQQTADENMLALEQLAAAQDPKLRARLTSRASQGAETAEEMIGAMGGDVRAGQDSMTAGRRAFSKRITALMDDYQTKTQEAIRALGPQRAESDNSSRLMAVVNDHLDRALAQEAELWAAVPKDAEVPTTAAKAAARQEIAAMPRAQQNDIPRVVRELLDGDNAFGDTETVSEMHGLYSELRRVARSAMAGNDQNKNLARVANKIADAILDDLGAKDGQSLVGKTINTARDFSRALHETFDQGEVGKLLNRTIDGDTTTAPEYALGKTVGRGGETAVVSDRQLAQATDGASQPFVTDYIKRRFFNSAISPDGTFTQKSAQAFMRENEELLARYPELQRDITDAVSERMDANAFAARMGQRLNALADERQSAVARFLNAAPEKAFEAILRDRNPAQAAARLAKEAGRDETGQALAGVKGAFAEYLMKGAFRTVEGVRRGDGDRIVTMLQDPQVQKAARSFFTDAEFTRLNTIASELAKVQMSQRAMPSIGSELSGNRANKIIESIARMAAADAAGGGGSFGGSLQRANIASNRVIDALRHLATDKASKILAEAIEDPDLFRALLTDGQSVEAEKVIVSRLAPYLMGSAAAMGGQQGDTGGESDPQQQTDAQPAPAPPAPTQAPPRPSQQQPSPPAIDGPPTMPQFNSPEDVRQAVAAGMLKPGDLFSDPDGNIRRVMDGTGG